MYGSVQIGLVAALLALAAPAPAADQLPVSLGRQLRAAGGLSGAYVMDLDTRRVLFSARGDARRSPASVEKLYTTATALLTLGPDDRIATVVAGTGALDAATGIYTGDLYLRGFGDPTFGSEAFGRRAYGGAASVTELADALADTAGISRVEGHLYGDESFFDRRRGVPSSGFALTRDVGPLSALSFNRGLANERGTAFQRKPARFAAEELRAALLHRDVHISEGAGEAAAPGEAKELVGVKSPPLSKLVKLTNMPSDNYLAEMLLKELGGRLGGAGSTRAGAKVVTEQLRKLGIGAHVVDGSGLSRTDRTSPHQIVRLLDALAGGPVSDVFRSSLAVAGRSGTLRYRMRGTAAQSSCVGKTGTLVGVSGLAGYCTARNGHRLAFAILMNGVNTYAATRRQDRMLVSLARWRG